MMARLYLLNFVLRLEHSTYVRNGFSEQDAYTYYVGYVLCSTYVPGMFVDSLWVWDEAVRRLPRSRVHYTTVRYGTVICNSQVKTMIPLSLHIRE